MKSISSTSQTVSYRWFPVQLTFQSKSNQETSFFGFEPCETVVERR